MKDKKIEELGNFLFVIHFKEINLFLLLINEKTF